ncbi:hypothetical protein ABZ307_40500 [Streptomyces griseorubiginosus]|uniref:hypothetical protein n=1 Tax=Streptomyces griseorubiginosus TaxID=67304 RepID=UPI0033BCEA28
MTSLAIAGCGTGQGSGTDAASERTGASGVQAKPLSEADLERATITDADLGGYEVERALVAAFASRKTADPAECAPVMQAVGGSSGFAATARIAQREEPVRVPYAVVAVRQGATLAMFTNFHRPNGPYDKA